MFNNIASISASIILGLQLTASTPMYKDKAQKPQWAKVAMHAPKLQSPTIPVSTSHLYILSVAEQQVFKLALLRSVKLVD